MTSNWIYKDFIQAKAILRDAHLKENADPKNKSDIGILKIIKAREEDVDFELGLAEKICGDGGPYKYRSSSYLTKFFQDLGFDFTHDGTTRRYWVQSVLLLLDSSELLHVIQNGLFRKKDFSDKEAIQSAIVDFQNFIGDCTKANETVDIAEILDLNANIELLFDNSVSTSDQTLDDLIEEAKRRFLSAADQQIALEKLWDAFERVKTYFGSNKKESVKQLIEKMALDISYETLEDEFKALTSIGNSYQIRHHEIDKIQLNMPNQRKYLFFRMLALIDLALTVINDSYDAANVFE